MFIRVRSAQPGDPDRDFDVPVVELNRNPSLYVVVDPEPSPVFRAPVIRPGVIRVPAARKRAVRKSLVKKPTAPDGA